MLVRDKLNVVGERHDESKLRRDDERRFCIAQTGSANYWTEADFPDLIETGRLHQQGTSTADLMEFRATHGAAMLIVEFDKLGDQGVGVSAIGSAQADAAIAQFDKLVEKFRNIQNRIDRSWRPSTEEVNQAVRAVYAYVDNAYRQYATASGGGSVQQRQKAVRNLANSRVDLYGLVRPLAGAVGAKLHDERDAAELARYMRTQRSTFMGLGAVFAHQVGVWKVGDAHITDLKSGPSNIDASRINLVTRDEFNAEFEIWLKAHPT